MRPVVLLLALTACTPAEPPTDDAGDTEVPMLGTPPGPGLGNLSWSTSELFQPVGWIDNDNGVPPPTPDIPITALKPFGTNTAYMHDGWMVTLFAPDSGFGPGGLLIYDVSDPRQPELVTRVWEPEPGEGRTWDFREAHAMGFSWQDGRKLMALHTGLGVQIWDLTDVHDPQRTGELDLPDVAFGDYEFVAWQLAWQGTHLYVAGAGQGLFVVDTSDPDLPVLADRGGLSNPIPPSELGGFRVGPVFAVGNDLIVSSMDNSTGYARLDASDPLHPTLTSSRSGLEKFYATCFSGGRVVTSARGGGARMLIDDLNDPFAPRWLDTDLVIDGQLYCGTQDGFVFQGCEHEVVKVDVSDPTEPTIVGRGRLGRPLTDHGQVTAFGNLVFVGNDHGTGSAFVVHDTEPDTTPPSVSFVSPRDGSRSQGLHSRIGITLTDNVTVRTVSRDTLTVRPEGREPISGVYTVQGHIVNFEPSEPLEPDTTYEVVVAKDGMTDWAGNPTGQTFRSSFTTARAAPDGPGGVLSVQIDAPTSVEVGTPITFDLVVSGASSGEASWRVDEATPWIHRDDLTSVEHTYDAATHTAVVVTVTDGIQRASDTHWLTVHRPLPPTPPSTHHTLLLDEARDRVWTANPDHDSVSVLDAQTLDLIDEVAVDAGPAAVVSDGTRIWVSCADAGTVVAVDAATAQVVDRVSLHPGARPWGLVVHPGGEAITVALEATGELVTFETATGDETGRRALEPGVHGLALSHDGATLYATRRLSPTTGGEVWEVPTDGTDAKRLVVAPDTTTADAEDRARGVPNLLRVAGLTPDETELWLPSAQVNIFRGLVRDGSPLTHESTVRGVVPRLLTVDGTERARRRLDLNDRPPPVDVAFTPKGDIAFLALRGMNRIAVHDAYTGQPLGAHLASGVAVDGLVVSADGGRLYAHHFLSRSVTAHDLTGLAEGRGYDLPPLATGDTVATEALDPVVLRGKKLFYAAGDTRISKDGYLSCVGCHPDGGHDGQTLDFTDRGEGLRNTIDLRGRAGVAHGPVHWTANFDEIQDFEHDIRGPFGGSGLMSDADFHTGTRDTPLGDPKAGVSGDLDALAAYVATLDSFPASPWREADGGLTEAGERGQAIFDTLGCERCHDDPRLTDSGTGLRHDVGTLTPDSGQRLGGPLDGLDTPTLYGLHATAPYLHDGRAATVREVFSRFNDMDAHGVTSPLSEEALDDLEAYLLQLD